MAKLPSSVDLLVTVADQATAAKIVRAIRESRIPVDNVALVEKAPEPEPDTIGAMSDKLRALLGEETPTVVEHNIHTAPAWSINGAASEADENLAITLSAQIKALRGVPGAESLIATLNEQIRTLRGLGAGNAAVEQTKRGGTQATRTGNGRAKLYSAAGTKRQMMSALESLRAGTMDAFVLADVIAKPGSRNSEIRDRLSKNKAFVKSGLSVESVDNIIWKLVGKGLISKADAK